MKAFDSDMQESYEYLTVLFVPSLELRAAHNWGFQAGVNAAYVEAKEALDGLTAFSELCVSMAYDEGLKVGDENSKTHYDLGRQTGYGCGYKDAELAVRESFRVEKTALHKEVQRLRDSNEKLRRETSNLRIKLDEALAKGA